MWYATTITFQWLKWLFPTRDYLPSLLLRIDKDYWRSWWVSNGFRDGDVIDWLDWSRYEAIDVMDNVLQLDCFAVRFFAVRNYSCSENYVPEVTEFWFNHVFFTVTVCKNNFFYKTMVSKTFMHTYLCSFFFNILKVRCFYQTIDTYSIELFEKIKNKNKIK